MTKIFLFLWTAISNIGYKMAFNEELFEKYPLDSLTVPSEGSIVYMKRYWIIHEGSVLRYKPSKAWQCNSHPEIIDQILKNNPLYEGCTVQFYEFLYIPR